MFCGIRSFSHVDDNSGPRASSPRLRPKPFKLKLKLKLKKKKSFSVLSRSAKNTKNPYSASGLDKFEKLLAELEAEKKKILLLKKGGSDEDTVRFRYRSNTEEWIPIVIKRPKPPVPAKRKKMEKKAVAEVKKIQQVQLEAQLGTNSTTRLRLRSCWNWSSLLLLCWAAVLLLCMVFGRAFAVSWAAVLWYMLPVMPWSRAGWTTVQDPKIKRIPI